MWKKRTEAAHHSKWKIAGICPYQKKNIGTKYIFPLVKREILEETAFPKEVRHQYVKTYIVQGTVLLA